MISDPDRTKVGRLLGINSVNLYQSSRRGWTNSRMSVFFQIEGVRDLGRCDYYSDVKVRLPLHHPYGSIECRASVGSTVPSIWRHPTSCRFTSSRSRIRMIRYIFGRALPTRRILFESGIGLKPKRCFVFRKKISVSTPTSSTDMSFGMESRPRLLLLGDCAFRSHRYNFSRRR